MKKLLLFAAVAGLGLVSASPPNKGPGDGAREAPRHYPPCSRTVRDRCIQLYERGVRAQVRGERHARMADHSDMQAHHGADHHRRGHSDRLAADEHRGRPDHRAHGPGHARGDHSNCPDHHAHARRGEHEAVEHRTVRIVQVQRVAGCRCAQPRRHYAQRVRRAGERG